MNTATHVASVNPSGITPFADAMMANVDTIIAIDTSGSTGNPSTRFSGRTLLQEMQEDCVAIAREAEKFDTDGLTLVRYSTGVNVADGVKADAVAIVFQEYHSKGSTMTHLAIDQIVAKARASEKELVLAVIFTDGQADQPGAVFKSLQEASREFGKTTPSGYRSKLGFVFVQVGEDSGAATFLESLNSALGDGYTDIVAVCTSADADELTIQQMATLAFNN